MPRSHWDDWFVRQEIEDTTPIGVTLWSLGYNGFVVRAPETTLSVDPYVGNWDPPQLVRIIPVPLDPGDATLCDILVTHEYARSLASRPIEPFQICDRVTVGEPGVEPFVARGA